MEPIVVNSLTITFRPHFSFQEACGEAHTDSVRNSVTLSLGADKTAARDYIESASLYEAKAGIWSEGNTPLPRTQAPIQSAPSSPSKGALMKETKKEEDTTAARVIAVNKVAAVVASKEEEPTDTVNGNAGVYAALNTSCGNSYVPHQPLLFPLNNTAQQMQLDSLREQVAYLQNAVKLRCYVNVENLQLENHYES